LQYPYDKNAGRVGDIVGNHGLDISAWEDGLMHGKNPFNLNSLVPNGRYAIYSFRHLTVKINSRYSIKMPNT
jgi:hypothetical protein